MSIIPPRLTSPFAAEARTDWEAVQTVENAKRVAGREYNEAISTLQYGLRNPRGDIFEECRWAASAARRAQVWAAIAGERGLVASAREAEARASRGMEQTRGL
jgi:hypothetical protein